MAHIIYIPKAVSNRHRSPVNGRRPALGAAIVQAGLDRATEQTPQAKADAIQQVADEMYRDASRWRWPRYIRHDEVLWPLVTSVATWGIGLAIVVGGWLWLVGILGGWE